MYLDDKHKLITGFKTFINKPDTIAHTVIDRLKIFRIGNKTTSYTLFEDGIVYRYYDCIDGDELECYTKISIKEYTELKQLFDNKIK